MALQISTARYVNTHAAEPKGNGAWTFEVETYEQRADGRVPVRKQITVPACFSSFREACTAAKRIVRTSYRMQDGVIEVCP